MLVYPIALVVTIPLVPITLKCALHQWVNLAFYDSNHLLKNAPLGVPLVSETDSLNVGPTHGVHHWFRLPSGQVIRVRPDRKEMGQLLGVAVDAGRGKGSMEKTNCKLPSSRVHEDVVCRWRIEADVSLKILWHKSKNGKSKQHLS